MVLLSQARAAFAVLFCTTLFVSGVWSLNMQLTRWDNKLATLSFQDMKTFSSELRKVLEEGVVGRYVAWDAYGIIQDRLKKHEANDFAVVKAANGRLYQGGIYPLYVDNARILAGNIADFAEVAQEKGMKVLYLNPPDTVLKNAPPVPPELLCRDYNPASDALLYILREKGLPIVDSRYAFIESGFTPDEISPSTSVQLSGKAGLALFTFLLEGLEKYFSLVLDPDHFYRNPDNYLMDLHSDFFLGELGKRSGPAFGGLNEFTAVAPAFETQFSYEFIDITNNLRTLEGAAEDTLLNQEALIYYENLYSLYPQSYYRPTNTSWGIIRNQLRPDGPRLLIIHDYYTTQVITHLAPLFGEIHTLAYQSNFTTSAVEYIEENSFDYVLISFTPANLVNPLSQAIVGVVPE